MSDSFDDWPDGVEVLPYPLCARCGHQYDRHGPYPSTACCHCDCDSYDFGDTVAIEATRQEPPVGDGETCVVTLTESLPAGTQLVVKHWPSAALTPMARWHLAARKPGELRWGPPGESLQIVRVEEGA